MSSSYFQQSRRAVYRVVYPPPERPRFLTNAGEFEVVDCSELGLRYSAPESQRPEIGATVEGMVVFKRGLEVPIVGEVVRVQEATIALWFRSMALSYTMIVAEQEYLQGNGYALSEVT